MKVRYTRNVLIFRYTAGIELISYENERENSSGTVSRGGVMA